MSSNDQKLARGRGAMRRHLGGRRRRAFVWMEPASAGPQNSAFSSTALPGGANVRMSRLSAARARGTSVHSDTGSIRTNLLGTHRSNL
eukprot:5701898-Amphidinium_carterae.1